MTDNDLDINNFFVDKDEYITKSLSTNRLAHSLLLESNDENYLNSCALELASCIIANTDPNIYKLCINKQHPDLFILKPAGKNGYKIEQINEIQPSFALSPLLANFKVYLFEKAELLNPSCANSLLKIIEEPPKNTYFILQTGEILKVLNTIVSRCTHLHLVNKNAQAKTNQKIYEIFTSINKAKQVYEIFEITNKITESLQIKQEHSNKSTIDKNALVLLLQDLSVLIQKIIEYKSCKNIDMCKNFDSEFIKTNSYFKLESLFAIIDVLADCIYQIKKNVSVSLSLNVCFIKFKEALCLK
ncbi:MAG: hypothetical protein MJ189_04455 [Coriobacteriales bacterium]|nr:hypothetical protein [Coriobacteriales bacterium]